MSMTAGNYALTIGVLESAANTPLNGTQSRFNQNSGVRVPYAYGTGPGRMSDEVYTSVVLGASASITYDLYAASDLSNVFGFPCGFRNIKNFVIWVSDGGDSSGVRIGGAGSNCWPANFADTSDKSLIYPDSGPWVCDRNAGTNVTSSAKNLKIENLGAVAVTLQIRIAGGIDAAGYAMGPLGLTYP
jgi:hypothetical protein